MALRKRVLLAAAVGLILFNTGAFVALDFFRFALLDTPCQFYNYFPIKLFNPLLCLLLTYLIGQDGVSQGDTLRLRRIFWWICLADLLFIWEIAPAGIVVFAICQVLLIRRHRAWLGPGLLWSRSSKLLGVCLLALSSCTLVSIFVPLMQDRLLLMLMAMYGYILTGSLWIALLTVSSPTNRTNSLLAAAGMLCFFACDLTVGLNICLQPGVWWLLSTSITWIFYTPALVLLALSGFKFESRDTQML